MSERSSGQDLALSAPVGATASESGSLGSSGGSMDQPTVLPEVLVSRSKRAWISVQAAFVAAACCSSTSGFLLEVAFGKAGHAPRSTGLPFASRSRRAIRPSA
jgi:hypothetical protein